MNAWEMRDYYSRQMDQAERAMIAQWPLTKAWRSAQFTHAYFLNELSKYIAICTALETP